MTYCDDRLLYKVIFNGDLWECGRLASFQKLEKVFIMHIINRK